MDIAVINEIDKILEKGKAYIELNNKGITDAEYSYILINK